MDAHRALYVNRDNALVSGEVGALHAGAGGHPHALALAGNRLRSHHIGENDVTIEVLPVNVLCGRIEACSTVQHSFRPSGRSLLPGVDLVHSYFGVERNDGKLCDLCKLVKLREERSEHPVIDGAGLVGDLIGCDDLLRSVV